MREAAVRRAESRDAPRIAAIKVANWRDTYRGLIPDATLETFLDRERQLEYVRGKMSSPGNLLLVAELEGRGVVGFALTFTDVEPEPWLESLHVARRLRGKGVGKALMRATAVELEDRGYTGVRLGVVDGNDAAARFYERLGAALLRRQPAEWAPGVVELIYRWDDLRALAS